LLSIASNTALFSLLGTTYGGDGRTTFALPDLRGRIPVHPGRGPGLSPVSLGQRFGDEALTLNGIPAHTHAVPDLVIPGDADRDGTIDYDDYLALKLNLGTGDVTGWPEGNFGFDNSVDRTDLMALMLNFEATGGAAYHNPEPSTLALLALGGLAVLRRPRRHPKRIDRLAARGRVGAGKASLCVPAFGGFVPLKSVCGGRCVSEGGY